MTTKTSITLSPKKRRCHGSPNLRKRRLASSSVIQQQLSTDLSLILFTRPSFPATITISCKNGRVASTPLRDLLNGILMNERQEMIVNVASQLRKVGDQIEQELQINSASSPSIDHIFGQRTVTVAYCLSRLLRLFL